MFELPLACSSMWETPWLEKPRLVRTGILALKIGEDMVSSGGSSFSKQVACPSSQTLLNYRLKTLAVETIQLVKWHLEDCDFCWCEVELLSYYVGSCNGECRAPAIPGNLKLLAEALFASALLARPEPASAEGP